MSISTQCSTTRQVTVDSSLNHHHIDRQQPACQTVSWVELNVQFGRSYYHLRHDPPSQSLDWCKTKHDYNQENTNQKQSCTSKAKRN